MMIYPKNTYFPLNVFPQNLISTKSLVKMLETDYCSDENFCV